MTDRLGIVPLPLCAVIFKSAVLSIKTSFTDFNQLVRLVCTLWLSLLGGVYAIRFILYIMTKIVTDNKMEVSPEGVFIIIYLF